jgi:hypothetical protein
MTAVFSPVDHPDLRKPGIVEAEKKKMNSIARSRKRLGMSHVASFEKWPS